MKKHLLICLLTATMLIPGIGCTSDNAPVYTFPTSPENPDEGEEPDDPDDVEEPESNYPEGLSVEAFEKNFDTGEVAKGYVVIADLKANPALRFRPTLVEEAMTPSEIFAYFPSTNAGTPYVTTNAGYFWQGASLSLCITDGEVKSIASQTAYPNDAQGNQVTAYPVRAALGQMADGTFEATWVYCVLDDGNKPYSFPSPLDNDESTSTYMAAPPTSKTEGAALWEPQQAIGGGPMLVYEGQNVAMDNYYREVLHSGGTDGMSRIPRTAIGATSDGSRFMLIVCDGRGSNGSNGLSISDLAEMFIAEGMDYAVNLDGGGSSTIVGYDGTVLNNPSDGTQRNVPTAVVVSEMTTQQ